MKVNIIYVILALSIVLITSIAYAAATNALNFSGTASLNENIDLDIIGVGVTNSEQGDTFYLSSGNNTLSFNLILGTPGVSKTVKFKITNVGNRTAKLEILAT